ncbi:hypothetical protein Hdeb2414_s0005g00153441 [Helianthus debilis subsp. tardiflorus]
MFTIRSRYMNCKCFVKLFNLKFHIWVSCTEATCLVYCPTTHLVETCPLEGMSQVYVVEPASIVYGLITN